MINKENNEEIIDNSIYKSFVGVKFFNTPRAYFFGVKDDEVFEIGEKVVVETMRGMEMGEIAIATIDIEKYTSELGLKPILRRASSVDEKIFEANQKDAVKALEIGKTKLKN